MASATATNKETGRTINKGDTITVAAMGIKVTGTAAVVNHWGADFGGWDIEINHADVPGGYSRWKQGQDGGRLVAHNGAVLDESERAVPKKYTDKPERQRITVNRGNGMGRTHSYIRNDGGRYIIEERPWSHKVGDKHLTAALAYFVQNNQYVTWMYNKEFESYAYGNYFDITEFAKAQLDFTKRGRD